MPRTPAGETRTTFPDGTDLVLPAIRLGWYVAEVSGRNNPNCPQPCAGQVRKDIPSALPLRNERTADELEGEAEGILAALASKMLAEDGTARARRITAAPAAMREPEDPKIPRPCGRPWRNPSSRWTVPSRTP